MPRRYSFLTGIVALFAAATFAAPAIPARYEANWDSLRDIPVPAWFDDAKFGIFIHWGVYSVAGFSSGYNYAEHFPQFLYRAGGESRNPEAHYEFMRERFGAAPPDFGYKYQPDFMWIDGFASKSPVQISRWHDYGAKLISEYLNQAAARGQHVYFNNKGGKEPNWPRAEGLGCLEADNLVLEKVGPKWQNPATLGRSYGYSRAEEEQDAYKSPTELIHLLCDVVSKNGNLLLNIGPRADGTIPEGMQRRLCAIGEWLSINGEAIYGTRPWRAFGEGVEPVGQSKKVKRKEPAPALAGIRFTKRAGSVYAILLEWPSNGKVTIESLGDRESSEGGILSAVTMLGSPTTLQWSRTAKVWSSNCPNRNPALQRLC